MIAEPSPASSLPSQKENAVHDETVPESAVQNGSCLRNGNLKTPREKRKVREQCENIRRNSSNNRRVSHLQNGEVVEAVTLFEVVSMGKRAMQSVVDDWVEAYKQDRNVALLDLISFFIQCSGCQGMVTAEMFQSLHKKDVMRKMTETFDEETGLQYKKFMAYPWILTVTWPVDMDNEDYPLIRTGPYWKKFKANFCEFIAVLVRQCQCSILYDSYLMDTIISLLTGLADSMVRAFRHTSTLAAMKLLTAVVSVHLNLDVNKHNAQRLYEVEKNRISGKRTSYRLDQLQRRRKEYEQKLLEIQNVMNAIFKGTFLNRYRDVIPEIRATCIEEIGSWMKTYPDAFLNDSYLKYIGWMLYDKQAEVRLKCLLGLQGIYSRKDLVSRMDLFTSRFKDRIVSMPLDKDHEVAVQAMKLLMLLSQNCEDVLSAEDCETLYQFVYTTHRPLAVAAGEFLYKRLLSHEGDEEVLPRRGEKFGASTDQLKTLIRFFLESELHKHVAYLVDSLWDWAGKFLKDWECMTTLLLKNAEEDGEALSDAHESALIEIILATVREAAEGHPPVGRGAARKILSVKEKKIQLEDCTKITEHFIMVLPQLLAKYSADAEKVTNLLQIPQYYDLDVYSTGHLEKHLDALLREVKDIVAKHSDMSVLEASSRTYYFLCSEEIAIYSQVDGARTQLIDELVEQLNQLLNSFWQKEEGFCADAGEISQIHSALRRIAAFHNAHDLTKWNLYDKTLRLLVFEMERGDLSVQMILPALQCTYFSLLWQLAAAVENSPKETLLALRRELRRFCQICMCFLHHKEKDVREKAFMILCDWLLILSHQDSNNNEAAGLLDYLPSTSLQEKLLLFIQEHVFMEEEEESKDLTEEEERKDKNCKLNDLHEKRSLLAAYCKLIVHNVVEMAAAAEIYKHYMKTYNDFGDIIKETLSRTRHNNKIQSAKTLILCLQQLFQTHVESHDSSSGMDLSSASFTNIKELARRFSLTFGWDQVKSRESVAMIHKEGIEFAFQGATGMDGKCLPPKLSFLLIISEFSNKLLKPDKRLVYAYLQRYIAEPLSCRGDEWQPLVWYRNSLLANEDEESSVLSSLGEWSPVGTSKTSSFKRKLSNGSLPETSHTEAARRDADFQCASQLASATGKSRKKLKSREMHLQEHLPFLCPAGLQRRYSQDEIKTEGVSVKDQAEDTSEDVDIDVVGADQDS
ncbi:cohesin subunit SA-2-like isoform X1 [Dromaius novaehollandiae]|uniref:Cohesin subunit SA n=2 Tax=Dromaius novaehollandiae TaxID=8790 RepID=A0A8C4KM16_DRONO|nr:cohesin subunit SA-2-like isoform X1 [Dromaius novaehollandiae]XP_025964776.1 cohesin subunit SA-2-like isoform X1 [Dromaius novaehollandiae]